MNDEIRPSGGLRVLIVEDDPGTAAAHEAYLERVGGFETVARVANGGSALAWLSRNHSNEHPAIDVILLDMNLPDVGGLEVARRIRAASLRVDIIAVTAVRELETVRASISFGVMQYIIKPFSFAMFADKLTRYRQFATRLTGEVPAARVGDGPSRQEMLQSDIDGALAALTNVADGSLPKGLSADTLTAVVGFLRGHAAAVSAGELTQALSISRITARRYLEYLTSTGQVEREPRYGAPGRPELEYRWGGG